MSDCASIHIQIEPSTIDQADQQNKWDQIQQTKIADVCNKVERSEIMQRCC